MGKPESDLNPACVRFHRHPLQCRTDNLGATLLWAGWVYHQTHRDEIIILRRVLRNLIVIIEAPLRHRGEALIPIEVMGIFPLGLSREGERLACPLLQFG